MDIEKAFYSLDHNFLISVLEKCGFCKNFISWIKTVLRNQEACVLNGSATTKCFLLGRGTHKGNSISAYLFILALEILFHLIRLKSEIKELAIFDHCYVNSAYADDTTFFLQDTISIKHIVDIFFVLFITLKKIWNCRYWSPKRGSSGSLCLRYIDLNNDTLKILGTHFS